MQAAQYRPIFLSVGESTSPSVVFVKDVRLLPVCRDCTSFVREYGLVCCPSVCIFIVEALNYLPKSVWISVKCDVFKCMFPLGLLFLSYVIVNVVV